MERLHEFASADFQFAAQEVAGVVNGGAEHIADTEEAGLLVVDDATVGRDGNLAIREGVKRIDGLVAARAGREVDNNFHVGRCHVLHLANLDFSLLAGADDAVNEGHNILAKGNFGDDQRLVVQFLNLRAHLDRTTAHTVVVLRDIDGTARLEIGIEAEVLALQIGNGGLAEFAKVVGKNLCAQTHGNAFCALGQQERELHGQGHGFAVAAIVGEFPLRSLGIEEHVEGKFRQAGLDVTRGSGRRAREDISPVTLAVDEQILLAQLHEGIADGCIAVGMELHGMAHDIGHLIVATIVQAFHGMEDTALHRLQAITDMGNGTLEDDIGGVVEKPRLKHARQLVLTILAACCGAVVAMSFFGKSIAVGSIGITVGNGGIAERIVGIPDFFAGVCVFVFFTHAVGFAGARAGLLFYFAVLLIYI